MKNFIDYIANRKTYVAAIVVGVIGILEGFAGVDVPGVVVGSDPVAWIIAGVTIALGRKAITDEVKGRI